MYTIKRFSRTKFKENRKGWKVLKDSDIWDECERVNDDILRDYNQKWKTNPFNTIYRIEKKDDFNKDYKSSDNFDKLRINRLVNDLKKGFLYVDNGNIKENKIGSFNEARYQDETHYLDSLSKVGEYLSYSKLINTTDRLTYKIFKPFEENGKSIIRVELNNCKGHRFGDKLYSEKTV